MVTIFQDAERVDSVDIERARAGNIGWCPDCHDFTTPLVNSDESRRLCRDCVGDRVCGVSHAIENSFIDPVFA